MKKSGLAFEWKELEASLAPLQNTTVFMRISTILTEGSGYDLVAKSQLPYS